MRGDNWCAIDIGQLIYRRIRTQSSQLGAKIRVGTYFTANSQLFGELLELS